MSIFIDTGIFIAYANKKDEHHTDASNLLEKIMKNKYGMAFTSDYVFSETVTYVQHKTKDITKSKDLGDLILGNKEKNIPSFITLLVITPDTLQDTWKSFLKYKDKELSFVDCASIELVKKKNIEYIASFDSDFDGILPKIS